LLTYGSKLQLLSIEHDNTHIPQLKFLWIDEEKTKQNQALPWLITGQIQKTSSYVQSKQEGTEEAQKPSRATVPLSQTSAQLLDVNYIADSNWRFPGVRHIVSHAL
jgi:hypothetical protein